MNELTTYRWSFDEDVHHYQRAGYAALGVWRRKLQDYGEERAAEMLAETGLDVSNLLWAGGFTGIDGRSLYDCEADARRAIETAAMLGAGCLVIYTGGRNNHTARHASRLVRGVLDRLVPVAEDHDVTLAIEPMHPACGGEWTLLSSLEETLDLLCEVGSRHLKLVYDTYHFPMIGDPAHGGGPSRSEGLSLLRELAPSIAVVHLGDSRLPHSIDQERCPLGEGRAPLAEIIAALLDGGYDGDFDVELMGDAVAPSDYGVLLEQSQRFFRDALTAATTPR
ncbi:MAG: sugar phosphate isomerase/epimerase family protein [Planctomycetota bacterium]